MKKSIYIFFISSCLVSWTIWTLMILSNKGLIGVEIPRVTHFSAAIGPLVGAIIASRFTDTVSVRSLLKNLLRLKVPFRWYMNSILYPVLAYAISAIIVYLIIKDPEYQFNSIINAFAIFFTIPFIVFGEEVGWRGFALPVLQTKLSPFKSSMIIGVMWAVWHVPAFVAADIFESPVQFLLALLGFTLLCMILSILFTWVVNASGGSVLMAVLMHSSVAASSSLTNIALKDPKIFFLLFMLVFLIMAIMVIKKYSFNLGYEKSSVQLPEE